MNDIDTVRPAGVKVFLSYARADKETARYIADELKQSGVSPWFDEWDLAWGDSIVDRIESAVTSSDIVLVLLSPASVASDWIQREWSAALSRELNDRAIRVLPVLIADCEIPPILATRAYLDLRGNMEAGVKALAAQLSVAPAIQFSEMSPRAFEWLVADLLVEFGFSVTDITAERDIGFDFRASYKSRDPFGAEETHIWLVEAKLYHNSRVSVSVLRAALGALSQSQDVTMGLIVTNGNLTSEARHVLQTYSYGKRLRVIEGTELTNLIAQRPALVERHFARGGSRG